MDVKFGKVKPKSKNIFSTSLANNEVNLFASTSNQNKRGNQNQSSNSSSRLNDLDSNILENNAYHDLPNEILKAEHKIGILENTLAKINSEIDALESLGPNIQIEDLKSRKYNIEKELIELNDKYSRLGLGARLSGQLVSAVNFTSIAKNTTFSKIKTFISKNILAKISKKISYAQTMKEALTKLSGLNSNVDELITMKVPYGETINRYEKLTAYINKANVIHSQISKNIKDISKNKT